MRYLDAVKIHKEVCQFVLSEFPDSRILTAWPHTLESQFPSLGYAERVPNVPPFSYPREVSDDERHFREAELILVSPVPGTPAMHELKTYA